MLPSSLPPPETGETVGGKAIARDWPEPSNFVDFGGIDVLPGIRAALEAEGSAAGLAFGGYNHSGATAADARGDLGQGSARRPPPPPGTALPPATYVSARAPHASPLPLISVTIRYPFHTTRRGPRRTSQSSKGEDAGGTSAGGGASGA